MPTASYVRAEPHYWPAVPEHWDSIGGEFTRPASTDLATFGSTRSPVTPAQVPYAAAQDVSASGPVMGQPRGSGTTSR